MYVYIWGVLKMGDPQVTMGFNTNMVIHDDWMISGYPHGLDTSIWILGKHRHNIGKYAASQRLTASEPTWRAH